MKNFCRIVVLQKARGDVPIMHPTKHGHVVAIGGETQITPLYTSTASKHQQLSGKIPGKTQKTPRRRGRREGSHRIAANGKYTIT